MYKHRAVTHTLTPRRMIYITHSPITLVRNNIIGDAITKSNNNNNNVLLYACSVITI